MSFRNLAAFNLAILGKQALRICLHPDSSRASISHVPHLWRWGLGIVCHTHGKRFWRLGKCLGEDLDGGMGMVLGQKGWHA